MILEDESLLDADLDTEFDEEEETKPKYTNKELFPEHDAPQKARDAAVEAKRKEDRQIALLIGAKNLERLRAFGYDCSKVADALPPITTDGRSLERGAV